MCNLKFINPNFVFQVGAFISAVTVLLFTMAHDYSVFLLCIIFFGVGQGSLITAANLIILTCVDIEKRASAFGLANFLTSLAILSSPPLAGKFL